MSEASHYPVEFAVDYPEHDLNRLTTALRIFVAIPILILLGSIDGGTFQWADSPTDDAFRVTAAGAGVLFFPTMLMLVFRQKYPRWWFDWNLEYLRFANRVWAFLFLLRDEYPSTDEEQAVHLDFPYPDAERDLNRWLPLIKWLLVLPHFIVLFFLAIGMFLAAIIAWFAILITGRYPKELFHFVVGVLRWGNRITGYSFALVTDQYPPFRLSP